MGRAPPFCWSTAPPPRCRPCCSRSSRTTGCCCTATATAAPSPPPRSPAWRRCWRRPGSTRPPGCLPCRTQTRSLRRSRARARRRCSSPRQRLWLLCRPARALRRGARARRAAARGRGARRALPLLRRAAARGGRLADLWGHSQHKTLNALTQAATLHLGRLSHPARAGAARALAVADDQPVLPADGVDRLGRCSWPRGTTGARTSAGVRRSGAKSARLRGSPPRRPPLRGAVACDPTRLVVDVSARNITGFAAMRALEHSGIFVEMADLTRLVLITSPADDPAWYPRLTEALAALPYGRAGAAPAAPGRAPGARRAAHAHPGGVARARRMGAAFARRGPALRERRWACIRRASRCVRRAKRFPGAGGRAARRAAGAGASLFGVRAGRVCVVDAPQTAKREGANGGS